jgi:hypothetical protein
VCLEGITETAEKLNFLIEKRLIISFIKCLMSNDSKKVMPKLDWKTTTCEVCGNSVDYLSKRRPKTCNNGECQYKFHYKINKSSWATHQPSLFD